MIRILFYLSSLVCISLASLPIKAMDYHFKRYEIDEGLSNNSVNGCVQDANGFLWIGTRDGLNRFDGVTFYTFYNQASQKNSLISDWINDLVLSPKGELWVSTNKGIQRYDYQTESFSLLPFTEGAGYTDIAFDHKGLLWMLSPQSLICYNEASDHFQTYNFAENDPVVSFYITSDDEFWAISKQGYIGKLDRRTQAFEYVVEEPSQTPVHIEHASTLYVSISHQIALVGTVDQGIKLVQLSDGKTQELIKPQKRQPLYARSIQPMNEDEIWIATFNGIYIYHLTTKTITHLAQEKGNYYSLSSNAIKRFCKDREGGIWICTDNGGINYLPPYLNFHKDYDVPGTDGIKGEVIHDLLQDPSGRIWIGTEDAGLNLFDPHTHTYKLFQEHEGLSQNCIHGLAYLNNQLWVGTLSNGIDVIDLSSQRIIEHYNIKTPSASNATIVYLYTTRQQQLYAATSNGVYRFENIRKRFEKYPYFPDNCRIQTLFEDQEGILWAGTFHNGLYYCDPNTGNRGKLTLNEKEMNGDLTINHMHEDSEHQLWIATGSGLLIYNRQLQTTTKLTADDGLPSNVVYRIEPDKADSGRLWLSTANGLVSIHRKSQSMMIYKREHGLLSNQFNYNSSLCAKEGKLYFGCLKGLISFYPNQIKGYDIQPTVYLTTLYYIDPNENTQRHKPITFKKSIELRHDQSSFTIEYTSFCYQAPHLTPYAYRLVGLEENWHHTIGHTHANYNKLRPGKYVFQVKAANLSGTWNEHPTQVQITILPPWWLSTTALCIYALLGICLFGLLGKFLIDRNKHKVQRQLKAFEHEKEKELYQSKIDFFLHIAHEIRTPLTLIKGPLDRMEEDHSLSEHTRKYLKTIDKNANWLLDLINQLLDFKKTEINDYPLTLTNEDAYLLLQETVDRFKDTAEQAHLQVEMHAQVETWTACVDRTAYIKILSNLLSNAVKYAEHWICVKFSGQNEQFVIDFMNDGQPISPELKDKIFEPFYRIASSAHKPGSGLGLPFARFLAEKHGGTLACEETNDGTILFRLTLPNRQTTPAETGVEQPQAIEARQNLTDPHLNPKKDCPHILIVEDHAEMAQFIAEELSYTYNITIAYNGVEALEQLREQSIQLIISDVMMPVMDGLTLLKTIRKDHQLCHIPFILLTAKCTEQTHMEGLEYGADAYFEKPFSIHLLTKQVANLLDSRNNIRDYYAHSPMVNLKLVAHTKADELFLQRVDDIIQSHIADEKLDVDMIAAKMNLSRPTLYRKINEISEMTPNEWIKITRLRKAAELILQGDLKIYEIAEAVGFNSQSYFSRTFAKQFHMSPTQYAKSNNVQLK